MVCSDQLMFEGFLKSLLIFVNSQETADAGILTNKVL